MSTAYVSSPSTPWALQALAERHGVPTAQEALVGRCRELLGQLKIARAPTPLRPIWEHFGARLERQSTIAPSAGHVALGHRGWSIRVSGSPQWRRMRFTVAHEIAHILLCDLLADDPVALRAAGDHAHWKQVERICNAAAAELLMPADSFRQAALETGIQPAGLRELYDRYLVSWETLLLRFTEVFDLSLVRFSTYSPNPTARRTLRALRNARGDWWLPEHLTSRHLIPDVVRGAGEQGWAASPSILVDVGSQRRRPAAMAVHLPTAHAIKSTRIPRLDGFDAPDEPELPFEVALFMQSAGKADWKTLVEM